MERLLGGREPRIDRELPSNDPSWPERTRPLLELLREGPRDKAQLRRFALASGFGWHQTLEQLSWLSLEGLAEGSMVRGWRVTAKGARS